MREHAVKGDSKEIPLPPQFFYNDEYLGNFVDFEEALEDDRIADFFRLLPNEVHFLMKPIIRFVL
ncbi:hypothetical protein DICVIV_14412 [Dictyocaulus viviparus]|uniref:SH3-binding, glutamic acid-rich protein n=1 Tax=Dictyocaulus viviparus TaxID=29172 RepID=A0A0D8X5F2_DICVI|nr:hypothetical protein DICVIV_14412 [Dictyocaulus viviparus]